MPRDDAPTPVRRLLMQSIMWLILGCTVVAAAAVNQFKRQTLRPIRYEVVEHRGVKVKLPGGWIGRPGDSDENSIVRRNAQYGDLLIFTVRTRDLFGYPQEGPRDRSVFLGEIDLGGTPARLMLQQEATRGGEGLSVLAVSRSLPKARVMSLSILVPGAGDVAELAPEIELIKQIAASVEVDPNY